MCFKVLILCSGGNQGRLEMGAVVNPLWEIMRSQQLMNGFAVHDQISSSTSGIMPFPTLHHYTSIATRFSQ